eukprot:g31607.t1
MDQLDKLRRVELHPGSAVHVDAVALLDDDDDQLATCQVPQAPTETVEAGRSGAAGRRGLHAQGRHLHPSLEPQCLLEWNQTWVLFPAIQTSQNMLRCSLTCESPELSVRSVFLLASEARPRCVNRGEQLQELNESNESLSDSENPPLCIKEEEPCSEKQLVDEMVDGLGIHYNSNVDMLSSINPSLVHVNGGAELAIYGDFPGENLTCGFEGVTYVDVARRVSPLELRCMAPRRTEYVEPPELFEVHPQEVLDASTTLRVWGSSFRSLPELRCGFASRQKRQSFLTHRIPTWTWMGRVRCSTTLAERALRSFVMFSAKPLGIGMDPFMCVSYMMDGTWVYHLIDDFGTVEAVPFAPRVEDSLVAEFEEGEARSLQGHMRIFAGTHLGYDRGDLQFLKDVGNLTEWLEDRAMNLPPTTRQATTARTSTQAPTLSTTSTTRTMTSTTVTITTTTANASGSDANESLPPIVEVWIAGGDFFVTREEWSEPLDLTFRFQPTLPPPLAPPPDARRGDAAAAASGVSGAAAAEGMPELRFRLAQVTPVMGPTSGGRVGRDGEVGRMGG